MKKLFALTLALSVLALAGCAGTPAPTTAPATEALTEDPTTVPESTPAPTTLPPDPVLEAGPSVTVDGTELETVLYLNVPYVAASAFLPVCDDVICSGEDRIGFSAEKDGIRYEFRPHEEAYLLDGAVTGAEYPILTNYETVYLPLMQSCELLGIPTLEDPENGHIYCTSAAAPVLVEEGVRIPILMYHGITDNTWGFAELFVSPSDLDAQIAYLLENGYDPITFEDFDHLEDFDKPVMLTFDDGYLDNYEEAFPILQKHNCKATFFLITVSVDRDPRTMTSAQAREMMDSGLISIQSHTHSHEKLSTLSEEEQDLQIRQSRLEIARICGRIPFVLCYPSGDSNARARELTMTCYNYGIRMNGGLYVTGSHSLDAIPRYYVPRGLDIYSFASLVSESGR